MKYMNLIIAIALLTLSGCASKVVDWDGDNIPLEEQRRMMDAGGIQYTDEIVTLATESDVSIVASKSGPKLTFENDYEIKQDVWIVDAHNLGDIPQCVSLQWKLMDFQFVSEHPSLVYVPGRSIVRVGEMTQMVWEMDGVKFVPESSGFLWAMFTREPNQIARIGDECTFILSEDELRKEEDVYEH